ncbi:response regulator [Caballeronia concitans]|uniref:Two-component response regulator n=1 Tax=Caballeronia concitans TaxID=1777133 RepID=A0A658QTC5_9BURK|nr:response regulator [Caballeronia concitans]KIG10838.1 response regulator receiver protein [Burkholderia sp. MR1]SAL19806.1 two-component response regulator [Caballeronia concitans]
MKHILVVDDESSITQVMKLFLEWEGFRVSVAHDGMEALEIDEEDPADAVVTDLTMPRMSGRELIEQLAARRRDIPTIVITGWAGAEDLTNVHTTVMRKPVALDKLRESLADMLNVES